MPETKSHSHGKWLVIVFFLIALMALGVAIYARKTEWTRTLNRKSFELSQRWTGPRPLHIFLGDSMVEGGQWQNICRVTTIRNCGLGRSKIEDVAKLAEAITDRDIDSVTLFCGINNLGRGDTAEECARRYAELIAVVRRHLAPKNLHIVSLLPMRETPDNPASIGINAKVSALNAMLKELSSRERATFVDVSALVAAPDGNLSSKLSPDGLHLNAEGYRLIGAVLCPTLTQK